MHKNKQEITAHRKNKDTQLKLLNSINDMLLKHGVPNVEYTVVKVDYGISITFKDDFDIKFRMNNNIKVECCDLNSIPKCDLMDAINYGLYISTGRNLGRTALLEELWANRPDVRLMTLDDYNKINK